MDKNATNSHGSGIPVWAGRFVGLVGLGLMGLGLGGLALHFVPFDPVQHWLNSLSVRGDAHVTVEKWARVVRLLIGPSLFFVVAGVLMLIDRKRVGLFGLELVGRLVADGRVLFAEIGNGIRGDGKFVLVVLGMITLGGCVARVHYLWQPLRHDEAWTFLVFALKPTIAAWTTNYEPNNHILNTLLVRLCHLIFGDAEWSLRLPALIAGTLLIPATYFGFRRIIGREGALIAAALVAGNSYLVEYAALARGYSLVCLCTVLFIGLAETLRRKDNLFAWGAMGFVAVTGFFAAPIMLYPFAGIVAWLTLARLGEATGEKRRLFSRKLFVFCVLTGFCVLMIYMPVFIVSGVPIDVAKDLSAANGAPSWWSQLTARGQTFWSLMNRDVPGGVSFVMALLAIAGVLGALPRWRSRPAMLPILLVIAVAITAAQRMVGYDRIWTYLIPFYMAAIGVSVAFLAKAIGQQYRLGISAAFGTALCAGLLILGLRSQSIFYSDEGGAFPQAPEMAAALAPIANSDTQVYARCPLEFSLEYYLRRDGNPLHVNPGLAHGVVFYVEAPRTPAYAGKQLKDWMSKAYGNRGFEGRGAVIYQYGPATLHRVDLRVAMRGSDY